MTTPLSVMDVLLEACENENEWRELEELADSLFKALGDDGEDTDPFDFLKMPEAHIGSPRPLPTLETIPTVKLTRRRQDWSEEEDVRLLALFEEHGAHWRHIARASDISRSDDAIRNRIVRIKERAHTPPATKRRVHAMGRNAQQRRQWTEEEDRRLLEIVKNTRAWERVARELPGRTRQACRNRVFRLTPCDM